MISIKIFLWHQLLTLSVLSTYFVSILILERLSVQAKDVKLALTGWS